MIDEELSVTRYLPANLLVMVTAQQQTKRPRVVQSKSNSEPLKKEAKNKRVSEDRPKFDQDNSSDVERGTETEINRELEITLTTLKKTRSRVRGG